LTSEFELIQDSKAYEEDWLRLNSETGELEVNEALPGEEYNL